MVMSMVEYSFIFNAHVVNTVVLVVTNVAFTRIPATLLAAPLTLRHIIRRASPRVSL